jgi:hypothetical protein
VKENLENLIRLLTETLELYRTILKLSREKREILVSGKAPALEALTRQEEALIVKAGKMEVLRAAIMKAIADENHLPGENITLTAIKEIVDQEAAAQLGRLEQEFDQVMSELIPLNEINTKLIQQALLFVNFNVNILAQAATGPVYSSKGHNTQSSQARLLFDRKV